MRLFNTFLRIFLFTTVTITAAAQTGTIRGFVYDKETGEAIIFCNVYLKGTPYGISTDVNGYYSISKIPPGSYTLAVSYLGYDSLLVPVTVKAEEIITKKLVIQKSSIELKMFDVSAEKQEAKTEVQISVTKVTPKEIKQVPSVGGEPDLAQYLQVLPGVIFTGDQGGQLYIRGGSPIQNKVLLDGMIIYNPFHSIGLFSVFDAEIIKNVDVYTGGFGGEYGGRISSIMDISTRDGNKKRYSGRVFTSPFTSKVLFEGPIKKADDEGGGSSSFLLSAKTSYLEQSSKLLYTYIDTGGLPYNFSDYYGKISMNGSNGSKFNMFGFRFGDYVRYRDVSDLNWKSAGGGTSFVLIPGSTAVLIGGNVAYSQYKINLLEDGQLPEEGRSSTINGFNLGLNFTYYPGKDEVKYGLEMLGFKTIFEFRNSVGRAISQTENTSELAGYIKYKKVIREKFIIDPSIRIQYYASLSELSPEPRLGMKYNLTDYLRLKFAGGIYTQNLISAVSDRDVVNLFYGFLSGTDNIPDEFDGKEVTSRLQKAQHAIFGVEWDITKNLDLNVEGYMKNFSQVTNLNRDKLYDDNAENASKPDQLKKDFIIENGLAKGVDFLLKYDYKRIYLWAVYSLGFVTRYDGIRNYVPHFDRRHNVNLVGSYKFGKNFNWEFDARWNLGSGFPFSQTQGYFEHLNFSQGINTDITKANGEIGILYGDLNEGRLSYYHRLDITIKREFDLSKNSSLEANLSVTNVYNRSNIFYINRITNEKVYQLPILPSVGVSWVF